MSKISLHKQVEKLFRPVVATGSLHVAANFFFLLTYKAEKLYFISRDAIVLVCMGIYCRKGEGARASVLITDHRAFYSLS